MPRYLADGERRQDVVHVRGEQPVDLGERDAGVLERLVHGEPEEIQVG